MKVGHRSKLGGAEAGGEDLSGTITSHADAKGPDQILIICNAYAYPMALDVFNANTQQKLTQTGPLEYKACSDYRMPMQEGDRLDFKAGDVSVGIFRATGIPKSRASLLLIPHRRDPNSLTVAFESHAFADIRSPQIAVVDTYSGKEVGKVKIMDDDSEAANKRKEDMSKQHRVEELRFNSVVALGAGKYQVLLQGVDKKDIVTMPLQVSDQQAKYVVMRTGVQAGSTGTLGQNYSFPQELVLYEQRNLGFWAARPHLAAVAVTLAGLMLT
eukprot:CAMPEP_0179064738 /NCGR_PEP_ID=MMETSP0796-20121207/28099_1 /TAXON_ID=73915 /ORGANISM="Pyrodinium bahamense, Strain pbaha01" /LENGTH=270 /DNA_ID=CAMNT_0020761687 /DNA_START=185 /DNA_END=994 /DNA_ORIENTATION=+